MRYKTVGSQTFDGLLQNYESALEVAGLGYSTRLSNPGHAGKIIREHEDKGFAWLDKEVIAEYLQDIDRRFYEGELNKRYYQKLMRYIRRFLSFCESGDIATSNPTKGSRYVLILISL